MKKDLVDRQAVITRAAILATVALLGTQLVTCTTTSSNTQGSDVMSPTSEHATTNSQADSVLSRLYTAANDSRKLMARIKDILMFPLVLNASFVVDGQYGKGVLRVGGGRPLGYYNITSASVGFRAGAQSCALITLFMTNEALQKFQASQDWTAGVDTTVTLAKIGVNGTVDTNTAQQPIIGFNLTNAGLMADASIEGMKITRRNNRSALRVTRQCRRLVRRLFLGRIRQGAVRQVCNSGEVQKSLARVGCVAGLESTGTIDLGGLDIRYGPNLRKGPNDIESMVIGPDGTFIR